MTNPAEKRSGRQRDGPPLQRACECAVSPRHVSATLHTFAGPVENRARRQRSSSAAASVTPEIFCGTPWHPAAAWDAVWTCPRAAARCIQSPASVRSKPAAPPAAIAPEDRGRAKHEPAAHSGRSLPRRNPQTVAPRAPAAAPLKLAERVPPAHRSRFVFREAYSRKHGSRSLFPGCLAWLKMKKAPGHFGGLLKTFCVGARYIAPLHQRSYAVLVNRPRAIRANALRLWLRLRNDRRRHRLLLERVLQDFVQRVHVSDFNVPENLRSEIRNDIRLVVCRQQDVRNSRALRSQHFFLYAADGQDHARERHLAGHRQAVLHRTPAKQAHQRGYHRRTGGRSVLRHRARRHMDVNVLLAEEVRVDAVALAIRARPGQCRGHRFLHHFAEMPGHGELLAAAHARGLDEDDVASHRRPDQSDGNAGPLDAFLDFLLRAELRHAQELANHFRCHHHLFHLAFGDAPRLFARDRRDLALQVAHTRFPREAVDDFPQPLVGEFDLLPRFYAVLGGLLGDQVLVRDVQLLLARIAGQFDDLHAVPQRFWDGIHPVRRGDEQHL